jgi:cysteine sulfinate desulfinase/cysteine desulfurase-like protein
MFGSRKIKNLKRIYLDYASATPIRDEAKDILVNNLGVFGNPGAIHLEGVKADQVLNEARGRQVRKRDVRRPKKIIIIR